MTARTVNDYGLEEALLEGEGFLVVAFLCKTSIPCEHFIPEFSAVAEKLEKKATFLMIDADENPTVTDEVGVMAVPTTVAFRDGDELARYEGPYSHEALEERLAVLMANRKAS